MASSVIISPRGNDYGGSVGPASVTHSRVVARRIPRPLAHSPTPFCLAVQPMRYLRWPSKKMHLSGDQVYPAGDPKIRPECREWIEMAARWLRDL